MIGQILGHYRLVERIGGGSVGTVYRAVDLTLNRTVALKVLEVSGEEDEERGVRFFWEAKAMAGLTHPHIVTLYELGCEGERHYMAMEYMEGGSLAGVIGGERRLPAGRAVEIAADVCRALDYAHAKGILHRDIKPGNVLLSSSPPDREIGRGGEGVRSVSPSPYPPLFPSGPRGWGVAKVGDFGIAKAKDRPNLTQTGSVLGTAAYLPPEVGSGGKAEPRSDLYSLGVVLYEMVTGAVPFRGDNVLSVIYKHINEEPIPPRDLNLDIPPGVEQVILRLLEKDPERRYASAGEVLRELERLRSEDASGYVGAGAMLRRRPMTRLVGRERELSFLRHRLDLAMSGEGGMIVLVGEAGIGKTRLMEELGWYAAERNVQVLTGRCTDRPHSVPYLPFKEILQTCFGIRMADAEALRERKVHHGLGELGLDRGDVEGVITTLVLDRPVGHEADLGAPAYAAMEHRLLRELTRFLIRLSRRRPLLLCLDDLHGADDRTLSAVEALAGEIGSFRILLIASYRPEEASEGLFDRMGWMRARGLCDEMELEGLSEEDMPAMVEDFARPVEMPKAFLSHLHRRTEGHPLFVVETLKLLNEEGVFVDQQVAEGWEQSISRVPSVVRNVLRGRVDHLSEEDVKLLEWASVQGEAFSPEILSSLLRVEKGEVLTRLGEVERRHRMVHAVQGVYRFDHMLLRDVLYEGMVDGWRQEVHGRIGEILEERYGEDVEPVLFELAYHVYCSGDYDRAVGYLLRAGEKAQTLYDSEGAVIWYGRVLEALEKSKRDDGSKAEVYERLGDAYRLSGRLDEAIENYRRLLETTEDRGVRSGAKQRIGWVYQGKHEAAAALRYLKEALEELGEDGRSVEAARIYLDMAMVHRLHGVDYDRAFALDKEALGILEGTDHLRELARAYRGVGFFYGTKGDDLKKGMDFLQRSLELSEKAGDLYDAAMTYDEFLCGVFRSRGAFEQAALYGERAAELFDRIGHPYWTAVAGRNLANDYERLGDFERALDHFRKAAEISERMGYPFPLLGCLAHIGAIYEAMGDREQARGQYVEGIERALDFGVHNLTISLCLVACLRGLDRIYRDLGQEKAFEDLCRTFREGRLHDIEQVGLTQWWWERREGDRDAWEVEADMLDQEAHWRVDPSQGERYRLRREGRALEIRDLREQGKTAEKTDANRPFLGLHIEPARWVREVKGDVAVEVRLRKAGDSGRAGGLIAWKDRENYLVFMVDDRDELYVYGREQGLPQIFGRGYLGGPVHDLRMERVGDRWTAWASADGVHWGTCGSVRLNMEDPMEAGVYVHSYPPGRVLRCEHFRLERPSSKEVERSAMVNHREIGPESGEEDLSRKQLVILKEVSRIVGGTLDMELALRRVMDVMMEVTGAKRGLVVIVDRETGDLHVRIARNLDPTTVEEASRISEGIVRRAAGRGEPVISLDARADPRFRDRESVRLYDIRSVLCLPLQVEERTMGTVYLDYPGKGDVFSPKQMPFYKALAERIAQALDHADQYARVVQENLTLRQELRARHRFVNIIGGSRAMQEVFRLLERVIPSSAIVLIEGETGTGKELIARAIHYNGPRKEKRFVTLDCGAFPEELLESELFGHRKGAFTGAIGDKAGLFEYAEGGTVFLDEICNAPPSVQARLLRVLQEGEIRRLGENEPRHVDVRILCATNRDVEREVEEGRLRKDLYYRLRGVRIVVPPLRERKEDIPGLAAHFLETYSTEAGKPVGGFTREAMDLLVRYDWPGNVRELEHDVERAVILCPEGEMIGPELLSEEIHSALPVGVTKGGTFAATVEGLKRDLIERALSASDGNITRAARRLGMSRQNLRRLMDRLKVRR